MSLPLGTANPIESWRIGFENVRTSAWLYVPCDLSRVSGALATAAVILLVIQSGQLRWSLARIAAVGKMALSNNLLTSIPCRFLFVLGPTHCYGCLDC